MCRVIPAEVFMAKNRSESREQALKLVFQKHFSPELEVSEIAELNNMADDTVSDEYALQLANTVAENTEMLDGIISSKLVKWTIGRLPKMSVAILRLAVAEILFIDGTPDSVTANEAVELTKKYVGEKEAGFVNAVLGAVIGDKESDTETEEAPAEE